MKMNGEIYTYWPFKCLEMVPVTKIEIAWGQSLLVRKYLDSVKMTGLELTPVACILCQILYSKVGKIGLGV